MKAVDSGSNTTHLMTIRWFTLLNVVILLVTGVDTQPPLLFAVVVLYCTALSVFWGRITKRLDRRPLWLVVDITLSCIAMALTGGGWTSPYVLYALTSLLIASYFTTLRGIMGYTLYFILLYTIGLFANQESLAEIEHLDLNLMLTTYMVIVVIVFFFSYPAHIIRKIERVREDTALIEKDIDQTKELLTTATGIAALTERELEILACLSEGKTNRAIAEALHLSESTIRGHLSRIYKKIGVSSREEAVYMYLSDQSAHI